MSDDRPIDRRRFFRQGLRELLKPLAQAADPLQEVVRQLDQLDRLGAAPADPYHSPAAPVPASEHWLRPPGALPEKQFAETCSRCGQCERICPAQCIRIDHSGHRGDGLPFIDVDSMPCVLCTGLQCMHNCPSGALLPTPVEAIDMGTAIWNEHLCVRGRGEECTICVDHCPVGEKALELREGRVHVIEEGCTGCGVCQHDCPTDPKSIVVMPRSARVGKGRATGTEARCPFGPPRRGVWGLHGFDVVNRIASDRRGAWRGLRRFAVRLLGPARGRTARGRPGRARVRETAKRLPASAAVGTRTSTAIAGDSARPGVLR